MDVFQKPAFWGIIAVVLIVVFAIFVIKSYVKKLSEGCCGSSGGDKVKRIKVKDKDKSHYPYKVILYRDLMLYLMIRKQFPKITGYHKTEVNQH